MTFSKGEAQVLLALAVSPGGQACSEVLRKLFHRPAEFVRARGNLVRWNLVLFDPTRDVLSFLAANVAVALGLDAPSDATVTPPLGWNERPLDAVLAAQSKGHCMTGEDYAGRAARAAGAGIPRGGCAFSAPLGDKGGNVERLSVETLERLNVKRSGPGSDSDMAERVRALQERIRGFVGPDDFARHWARAGYLWVDRDRLKVMEGSVNYFLAGVRSGEVTVKTSNGRALWSQVQCDWRKRQQEAAGQKFFR